MNLSESTSTPALRRPNFSDPRVETETAGKDKPVGVRLEDLEELDRALDLERRLLLRLALDHDLRGPIHQRLEPQTRAEKDAYADLGGVLFLGELVFVVVVAAAGLHQVHFDNVAVDEVELGLRDGVDRGEIETVMVCSEGCVLPMEAWKRGERERYAVRSAGVARASLRLICRRTSTDKANWAVLHVQGE